MEGGVGEASLGRLRLDEPDDDKHSGRAVGRALGVAAETESGRAGARPAAPLPNRASDVAAETKSGRAGARPAAPLPNRASDVPSAEVESEEEEEGEGGGRQPTGQTLEGGTLL